MNKPVINMEERIDRVVGRRSPPKDSFSAGMQLQSTAMQLQKKLGNRWPVRGVFRFKTHEEADAWMARLMVNSQTPTI